MGPAIVVTSAIFSLWSLTGKVAADDTILFKAEYKELNLRKKCPPFNWQYLFRVIAWRFCEISSHVCMLVLIWINLGGVSLSIILSIELIGCFIFCIIDKTPDMMGNMMYLTMSRDKKGFRFFKLYRFLSHYILLILITIFAAVDFDSDSVPEFTDRNSITFAHELGLIFFVWSWMGGIISHWAFIGGHIFYDSKEAETNRDIVEYLIDGQFAEAEQLLMFGVDPKIDRDDNNILHGLCKYGSIEGMIWIKKYCKKNKEYINAKNYYGMTPIMECVHDTYYIYMDEKEKQEREEIILFLLKQGAETHHKDEDDHDILHYCKENGLKNAELEDMLLKMQKVDDDEKSE